MKFNKYYLILSLLSAALFCSCLGDGEEEELSANPYFVSLTFAENDSIPGLEDAVFSLEYDAALGDSIIVNLDSLPFQTRIDSVFPTFYFRSTSGAMLLQETEAGKTDTVYLTGSDTINFSYPTSVYNRSSDETQNRTYRIKVNVHQIEPELYIWDRLTYAIITPPDINQKALLFTAAGKFLFFVGSETETSLYTADGPRLIAGSVWTNQGVLSIGNTASLKLRYLTEHDGALYVTDNDGKVYRSADGKSWTTAYDDGGNSVYNLLFSVNGALWAITTPDNLAFYLASSTDGTVWERKGEIPQYWQDPSRMFPVDDYSALVFKSPVGKPKLIVAGGYNKEGKLSRTTWLSADGVTWDPLRDDALDALHNAALASYDGKLFLFGGMVESSGVIPFKESKNEGLSWATPDSTYNMLPTDFPIRSYQSVFVDENDKRIYLIGGKDGTKAFADVWTAKLNRMYFDE